MLIVLPKGRGGYNESIKGGFIEGGGGGGCSKDKIIFKGNKVNHLCI